MDQMSNQTMLSLNKAKMSIIAKNCE